MNIPEHGLDVDDGLGVGHVVLLGAHGALLVHNHQVISVDDSTLEQVVQAARSENNHRRCMMHELTLLRLSLDVRD